MAGLLMKSAGAESSSAWRKSAKPVPLTAEVWTTWSFNSANCASSAASEQRRRRAALRQREYSHDIGRRLEGADLLGDALRDRVDGHRRALTAQSQTGTEREGARGAHKDDLRPLPGGNARRDQVGALNKEGAFSLAVLALAQRRRPLDESILSAAEWFA